MARIGQIFNSRTVAVLVLGISSGFPYALTHSSLQAWLYVEGVSLKGLGFLSLLGLPYALKFLWAPFLDAAPPRLLRISRLSTRQTWIWLTQILSAVSILVLSFMNGGELLQPLLLLALLVAIASASHDVVVDAYRVEVLRSEERGVGASFATLGYRIGLLLTGAFAFMLAERIAWPSVFRVAAAGMAVLAAAPFFIPKTDVPEAEDAAVSSLWSRWRDPFGELLTRHGVVTLLLFVALFKVGDSFAANMATPFLLQLGYSQTLIGAIGKGAGLFSAIAGSLVGGVILTALPLKTALLTFGVLQMLSTASYILLLSSRTEEMLFGVIAFENFTSGLGGAAFVAFLIAVSNKRWAATQYAVLTGIMSFAGSTLSSPGGSVAELIGWFSFFIAAAILAAPALILCQLFFEKWLEEK